jgi:pSer/pThr/pTyr-binding forkhead associated (FHA) protein
MGDEGPTGGTDPTRAVLRTPVELQEQLKAERSGAPFLVYRDGEQRQVIVSLSPDLTRVIVGRGDSAAVKLDWDAEVSRVHAELAPLGGDWTIADDGLSRNGTFLNGERVLGRVRLRDRDQIRFGQTAAIFRHPQGAPVASTALSAPGDVARASLSDTQRRVLISLCRPFKDPTGYPLPASNQTIADEQFISVSAVKTHLRVLFGKFGIDDLPQNEKRMRLAELAVSSGVISPREL